MVPQLASAPNEGGRGVLGVREIPARRVPFRRVVLWDMSPPAVYDGLVLWPAPGVTCLGGGMQSLEAM